ncbi:serine/threonine-protein kinase [Geodermatophilus sp. SYSU D00708]
MVEPGRRSLGDRYELAALIAAGGMGQVWRGVDNLLGRPVAVKVLRSEYTADPTFRARFRAEAQHAAALSHPNIAAVFDYGETETPDGEALSYLVMELVEGEPLSAVLHREGRLDAEATLCLLEQTASALAEAHRVGLVHRDVKPGNILIRVDGSVKITDFGIAWSADSVPLTRTGQVIGTPQYLAPEVAEGKHATPASDVYALGLVGYECLCGHPAFEGDNAVTIALKQVREDPRPMPDELPGEVRSLIRRALSKDPAVRMPDGAAFVAAIGDIRAGRPQAEPPATRAVAVPPPPPGSGEQPAVAPSLPSPRTDSTPAPHTISPPVRRRHRAAAVLVPLLTLLLGAGVAAGVFVAVNNDPSPSPRPAAQTEDATIALDSADYVGRPVDEVALALSALGLLVSRQQQVSPDSVPGLVTGLEPPRGSLRPGDEVVVRYAVAPPSPGTSQRASTPQTGHAGGESTPATPAPQEDAAPAAPPSASEAPQTTQQPGSAAPSSAPPTTSAPTTTTAPTTTSTAPTTTTAPSSSATPSTITRSEDSWPPHEDDEDDD